MASIIQSDNVQTETPDSFTHTYFEAAFGMPNVQGGNAIVVFAGGQGTNSPGANAGVVSITDNYGNLYEQIPGAYTINRAVSGSIWQDIWWAQNVKQVTDPGKTFTLSFTLIPGSGGCATVLVECSGINGKTPVVAGVGFSIAPNVPVTGPSVNGGSGALYLASLCSIFASSGDEDNSPHASVNSPWALPPLSGTGIGGSGFSWSGSNGPIVAGVVSSGSQQPIFDSSSVFGSFDDGVITAVAFTDGGGSGGGGPVFLGSVRVLGNAPAGRSNPFLGMVKVVNTVPSGAPNPYLGSVVVGTPSGSQTNPSLGEVVIVSESPVGDSDPFLGTVEEA